MATDSEEELVMHPYDPFRHYHNKPTPFNYEDTVNMSALLKAVSLNDAETVQELINAGKSVHVIDNNGNSALHIAIIKKRYEMVSLLLKHEINVDHQNFTGHTPLLTMFECGAPNSTIIQLLEAGCSVNMKNNMEDTPLHLAVSRSNIEVMKLLIKRGANINAQDGSMYTPLHEAVHCRNLEAVCMLLYYNADVSLRCHNRLTPFTISLTSLANQEVTKTLFPYYDNFTRGYESGSTPFYIAVSMRHPITADLIQAGVNRGFTASDAGSALCYAMDLNDFNLFQLIINQISKKNVEIFLCAYVLEHLISNCKLSNSDWLNYFYTLLGGGLKYPPLYNQTIKFCIPPFIKCLYNRRIDLENRKSVLWTLLCYGFNTEPSTLSLCFSFYGYNYEVDILYQSYNRRLASEKTIPESIPLLYFDYMIMCTVRRPDFGELYFNLLKKILQSNKANEGIYSILFEMGHTYFSPKVLQMFSNLDCGIHQKFISEKLSALPRVPSLLELGRNQTGFAIISNYRINQPYQYFDVVNRLHAPRYVKDLLLFKTHIYKV